MPMQQSDRPEFARLLVTTGKYYGRDFTPDLVEMYWNGLADIDLAAIRQALNLHIQNPDTGQFLPKVADIRKAIGGTTQDAALIAWAKVHKAIRTAGGWVDVVFDDPLIHAVVVDMGGWTKLCETLEDELPFRAKEFENRYRGYARNGGVPAVHPKLLGRASTHNLAKGQPVDDPVLIGAVDGCRRVLNGTATYAVDLGIKRIK